MCLQVLEEAIKIDDEVFIALGAYGLAYTLLLGGNGPVMATTDLSTLVSIANAAITTLDKYNMSTAVLGIAVRLLSRDNFYIMPDIMCTRKHHGCV